VKLVDWDVASATAIRLVPPGPRLELAEAVATVEQLRGLAAEAGAHVRAYTGLAEATDSEAADPAVAIGAAVAVVDRPGWVRSNVAGFADLVDPLLETVVADRMKSMGPVMGSIGPRATGVEVGGLLAYLATRVLGQFELFGPAPAEGTPGGRLTLVAPNIVAAERALDVDATDFRLWVCLHEVTHRTQFAAAPWLHGHVRDLLREYLAASDLDPAALLGRLRGALRSLVDTMRGGAQLSLLELVQTPEQRLVLERVTGLMSLLEGHADVVMDGVGPSVVPSVATIRGRFEQRRSSGSALDKAFRRVLGIDMKMRQYAEGAAFVRAVLDAVGMAGLNRVWSGPEMLPDAAEIRAPARWLERVAAAQPLVG
jgi:coenzyme F420 biosynthesis associated uncharacterized protein